MKLFLFRNARKYSCLIKTGRSDYDNKYGRLPGEYFNLNKQCEYYFNSVMLFKLQNDKVILYIINNF